MFDSETTRNLLREAYEEAFLSPDPSNQNRALVVDDYGTILARACNHVPSGLQVNLADRDLKLRYIAHAEEAVTYTAARLGVATRGKILICPWFACPGCARAILLGGYHRVIGHRPRMDTTPARWRVEVDRAHDWLTTAGVTLQFFEERLPEAPLIRVDGDFWQP